MVWPLIALPLRSFPISYIQTCRRKEKYSIFLRAMNGLIWNRAFSQDFYDFSEYLDNNLVLLDRKPSWQISSHYGIPMLFRCWIFVFENFDLEKLDFESGYLEFSQVEKGRVCILFATFRFINIVQGCTLSLDNLFTKWAQNMNGTLKKCGRKMLKML